MTSYQIKNIKAWIARPRIDRRLDLLANADCLPTRCRSPTSADRFCRSGEKQRSELALSVGRMSGEYRHRGFGRPRPAFPLRTPAVFETQTRELDFHSNRGLQPSQGKSKLVRLAVYREQINPPNLTLQQLSATLSSIPAANSNSRSTTPKTPPCTENPVDDISDSPRAPPSPRAC